MAYQTKELKIQRMQSRINTTTLHLGLLWYCVADNQRQKDSLENNHDKEQNWETDLT